jgi:hypothetical protein
MSAVLPSPAERLSRSREQLRLSLTAASRAPGDGDRRRDRGAAWTWGDALLPGIAGLVRHWWSGHPLRAAAGLAAGVTTLALRPLAARHPWGLVAGAVVLGGLLAWTRPWRWTLKPALLAGVLPQLLLALLKTPPQPPPAQPAP